MVLGFKLVGPDQAASAFIVIQLRGLEARGHKSNMPKRQSAPFRHARLMLVASRQSPSAFIVYIISQCMGNVRYVEKTYFLLNKIY